MKKIKEFWFYLKITLAFLFMLIVLKFEEFRRIKLVWNASLPESTPEPEPEPEPVRAQNGTIVPSSVLEKIKRDMVK